MTTVLAREDADFVYVPLTRCGSTWLSKVLTFNGFETRFTSPSNGGLGKIKLHEKQKLIVVRHPLQRLISAMVAAENFDLKIIYDKNKIFEILPTDIHTSTQVSALRNINYKINSTFIEYHSNHEWGELMQLYMSKRIPNFMGAPEKWEPVVNPMQTKLAETIYSDSKVYDTLMKYLKEDWDFYNKITWYGTN